MSCNAEFSDKNTFYVQVHHMHAFILNQNVDSKVRKQDQIHKQWNWAPDAKRCRLLGKQWESSPFSSIKKKTERIFSFTLQMEFKKNTLVCDSADSKTWTYKVSIDIHIYRERERVPV